MNHKSLIKKFFQGKCSSAELAELHQLLQNDLTGQFKEEFREIWDDLKVYPVLNDDTSQIILENILGKIKPQRKISTGIRWIKYAAALLILMIAAFTLWITLLHSPQNQIATKYGEIRKVILPDGSLVHLNANSSLSYSSNFINSTLREVWLEGEAFFKVNELEAFQPDNKEIHLKQFIVHAGKVKIEVVGTQFNVKNRRNATEIVLDEGEIHLKQDKDDKNYVMKPGDKATVGLTNQIKIEKLNDPSLYSSWRQNEMYFDGNTLQQISEEFEDNFGLELIIDEALKNKKFTGFCPADNPEILIKTLEKSFQLKLIKKENKYILKR